MPMPKPVLVICTKDGCGVVFDIRNGDLCDGHSTEFGGPIQYCYVCPLGHAGHNTPAWWAAKRREPTESERELGITFMLEGYDVKLKED